MRIPRRRYLRNAFRRYGKTALYRRTVRIYGRGKFMKVAVICEYSGTVRNAFIRQGHDAISFDILETEAPGPHVVGDVQKLPLSYWEQFDLIIAHPPCTYLSYAANHVWNAPGRAEKREQALDFFVWCTQLPVKYLCVENPVGYPNTVYRKPNQIVHPYYFGDPFQKRTCFWTKNLPNLEYYDTIIEKPKPIINYKTGRAQCWTESINVNRAHVRSKTFPGIAEAMAKQWGSLC